MRIWGQDDRTTNRELPLDGLHDLLVGEVGLLPPRLDLLWQLILVPGSGG